MARKVMTSHLRIISKNFELETVLESVVHSFFRQGSKLPAQVHLFGGKRRGSVGKGGIEPNSQARFFSSIKNES